MSDENVYSDGNPRDDLIFKLIKERLDGERVTSTALDNKAGSLIGFTSVVIGLLLGGISLKLTILIHNPQLSVMYFVGVGILLLSIFFSLMVVKIRAWVIVPDVTYLLDNYTTKPYEEVLQDTGATMAKAVKDSEGNNKRKARYTHWSWCFLLSGLALVFIFIVLYFLTGLSTNLSIPTTLSVLI